MEVQRQQVTVAVDRGGVVNGLSGAVSVSIFEPTVEREDAVIPCSSSILNLIQAATGISR